MAKDSRMRVVLQDRNSLLYFQDGNTWTPHRNEAKDFEHVGNASAFESQNNLTDTEIILLFGDDQRYDLRLRGKPAPLPVARKAGEAPAS